MHSPVVEADEIRWLEDSQQRSWRALVMGTTLLFDRLDDDLRRTHDISLVEYEILVRLSERDGQMRMAALADALAHSRSRVTHTVTRMEKVGLVSARSSPEDGRGILATLTDKGTTCWCAPRRPMSAGVRDSPRRTSPATRTSRRLGRVFDAVADSLDLGAPRDGDPGPVSRSAVSRG